MLLDKSEQSPSATAHWYRCPVCSHERLCAFPNQREQKTGDRIPEDHALADLGSTDGVRPGHTELVEPASLHSPVNLVLDAAEPQDGLQWVPGTANTFTTLDIDGHDPYNPANQ